MRPRAALWWFHAALAMSACAQGEVVPSRDAKTEAEPAIPPDNTPGSSFNVTPSAGTAGTAGAAGRGNAGGSSSNGGAGASNSAPSGGAPAGGRGSTSASGGAGVSSSNPSPGSPDDCPSPTRVRSRSGVCVDRVVSFTVGGAPAGLVAESAGTSGSLWFDDEREDELVQVDFAGNVSERVSHAATSSRRTLIAGDGDAILWFTSPAERSLSKLNRSREVVPFDLGVEVAGLALERANTVWITEANRAVYRLVLDEPPDVQYIGASPTGKIVMGPDRRPWFVTPAGVARATDVAVDEFPQPGAHVVDICSGPSASLWFSDDAQGRIGRVETNGRSTYSSLPSGSEPQRILAGPDDALWFTERGRGVLGRLGLDGNVNYFPLPEANVEPSALAVGGDGNIWFTQAEAGKVGRLTPDS